MQNEDNLSQQENKPTINKGQPNNINPIPNASSGHSAETSTNDTKANIDASKIYPEAKINPLENADENKNSSTQNQSLAKAVVKQQSAESNRAVSMRVKSLLVLGIFYFINAAITITLSSWLIYVSFDKFIIDIGKIENILFLISIGLVVIQLLLSVYLIVSRDNYRVAFILKIFLVLQILSVFSNLFNLTSLVISGLFLIFIWYVYSRVKNLNYLD